MLKRAAYSGASALFKPGKVHGVMGSQFGDEGKGKLVDALAKDVDVVARFNGGANAGHTVICDKTKFALHLLPSGVVQPGTKNLLGNGMVINPLALVHEMEAVAAKGVCLDDRVFISNRAHLVLPFHQKWDLALEVARGQKAIGTTGKGIGPAYAMKALRSSLRVEDMLLPEDQFAGRIKDLLDMAVNLGLQDAKHIGRVVEQQLQAAAVLRPRIVDGVDFLHTALHEGRIVLAEGANAGMLDLDFGTYPMVTSSSTTAGGICTGLGVAPKLVGDIVGVVKAYTTRVGWGPFPAELTDARGHGCRELNAPGSDIGLLLQTIGNEFGVTYVVWVMAVVVVF